MEEQMLQPFLVLEQVCIVASGVCLTEQYKKTEKKERKRQIKTDTRSYRNTD